MNGNLYKKKKNGFMLSTRNKIPFNKIRQNYMS